jgi:hypothetical protein
MDKQFLLDYEKNENEEYIRFEKALREGTFKFGKDRFPADHRFVKLQEPIALPIFEAAQKENIWAQIPFSGSLIFTIAPYSKKEFERLFFDTAEIPKIIDFIKETGRLQVILNAKPSSYVGLDYLDPVFLELRPPILHSAPYTVIASQLEITKAQHTLDALARVRFDDYLRNQTGPRYDIIGMRLYHVYMVLKLGNFPIANQIENFMIDDPAEAAKLLDFCLPVLCSPLLDPFCSLYNSSMKDFKESASYLNSQQKVRFPYEIGKFLVHKLTFAPEGMRACNELIDHYDAYDLRKVLDSLNDAIVSNSPDVMKMSADELSTILDNVWNDKTIPKRIKGLKIGVPLSFAVLGSVAGTVTGGPLGATIGAGAGFLTGLGFQVAEKALDIGGDLISEKISQKLPSKSYQMNIYNFKEKYGALLAR